MKKHYVLASIERPNEEELNAAHIWIQLQSKAGKIELKDEESRMLQTGCWLLVRDNEASALAHIVRVAEEYRLKFAVRYLVSDE